ncbi:MAG: DUF5329 family protein [Candidatus Omnitrophota bacterium]|nr:DUF5329 family protein [Candidatus Omnitrophota bacterium]
MFRLAAICMIGFVLAGCQSTPKKATLVTEPAAIQKEVLQVVEREAVKASSVDPRLFLDTDEVHRLRVEEFLASHPQYQEADKIQFILKSIRNSLVIFIRNRHQYDADKASRWLQWKMHHAQFRDDPILTGWDFVNRVANRSLKSGEYYQLVLATGMRVYLQDILKSELEFLEESLQDRELHRGALPEDIRPKSSEYNNLQPPVILPAN